MTAHAIQSDSERPHDAPSSSHPPSQLRAVTEPLVASSQRSLARRSTAVLYAACARALEGERVIWDVGCGEGHGTALLASEGRVVVGIDGDPEALATALAANPDANSAGAATERSKTLRFVAELPTVSSPDEAPDLIVVCDVLGYVPEPDVLLLELSLRAKPTTTLLLWEPKAEPTQQLPAGKLRAFSAYELAELAALGGWQPQPHPHVCEAFSTTSAARAPDAVLVELTQLLSDSQPDAPLDASVLSPELSASVHLRRARRSLRDRDGNATTSHLLAALNAQPENTEALCGLAHLAISCGSERDALRFLQTCLDKDPVNVAAMELWVRFLAAAGPGEQLAGFQTLANLSPADANVLSTLAQLHAANGDPLLAIQDLERLRRYHPAPSLDLSLTLGWLLNSVGRKSDAEVEARLASLIDPDGPDVRELLAAIGAG